MSSNINILDTTLRDGSYAINFAFSSNDTSLICKKLEDVGVNYIEIGHGLGLNASARGYGEAIQTDEEYLIAASSVLSKANYGMFCIPGIARLEDIDLAAKYNMKFIRIGTNVTEVENSKEYIERAKRHGMFVCSNFMKSYVLEPEDFAKKVKISENYGSDMVYLVDSSGGMFPSKIEEYYHAIRQISGVSLGFHGHNNLNMAVINSVHALKLGFEYIDTSLQGLGRSSGNAQTEILVATLDKMGYRTGVDLLKILDVSFRYIYPLVQNKGFNPLDVIAGYADFHTSYMSVIHKYSAKYSVNPAKLIIELTKHDKVNAKDSLVESIAKNMKKEEELYIGRYGFNKYFGHEQDDK